MIAHSVEEAAAMIQAKCRELGCGVEHIDVTCTPDFYIELRILTTVRDRFSVCIPALEYLEVLNGRHQ